jgi:membrane protein implicated in regulation of membrane protease activity
MHLEGSGYTKLAQVIRLVGFNNFDRFELATVTQGAPNVRIKPDHTSFELEGNDLIIAEHLTDHTITFRYEDGTSATVTLENGLKAGDRVIVASMNDGQMYVVIDRAVINQ